MTKDLFISALHAFLVGEEEEDIFVHCERVVRAVRADGGHFASERIADLFVQTAKLGLAPVIELFLKCNKDLVGVIDEHDATALARSSFVGHTETVACLLAADSGFNKADQRIVSMLKRITERRRLIDIAVLLRPLNLSVLVHCTVYKSLPLYRNHKVPLHYAWKLLKDIKQR